MSKSSSNDVINSTFRGLFQSPVKAGEIDWKTGRRMSAEEVAQKNSQTDIELKEPPSVFKSPNVDSNEEREVVDLTGHVDEIRLFVVQSLTGVLKALMNRIHSEKTTVVKVLKPGDIFLNNGAFYESEYEVNITEIHKIVFDIHVNSDMTSTISMQKSTAKVDIENFHTMEVEEVVKKFIHDADVLEVLYD